MRVLGLLLVTLPSCSTSGGDCALCMREKCSDLIALCDADAGCACVADCTGEHGIPGVAACLDSCGLDARPAGFADVEACTGVACPDTGDECATPFGWVPPADETRCSDSATAFDGGLADCGFDPALRFDPAGAVLQLQSADGGICARVERRDDGSGNLANTSWALLDLRVGSLGRVARIDSASDLCWYSSHHNFLDWAHAWSGTRHFDLLLEALGHGGERTYDLYVFEAGPLGPAACGSDQDGSQCLSGPIALFPVNP